MPPAAAPEAAAPEAAPPEPENELLPAVLDDDPAAWGAGPESPPPQADAAYKTSPATIKTLRFDPSAMVCLIFAVTRKVAPPRAPCNGQGRLAASAGKAHAAVKNSSQPHARGQPSQRPAQLGRVDTNENPASPNRIDCARTSTRGKMRRAKRARHLTRWRRWRHDGIRSNLARMKRAGLLLSVITLAGCAARPQSESAPIPALSAVAQETKTPTTDPAPGTAESAALTMDECRSRPGEVLTDKGDGSLHRDGCPDGRRELGKVRVGVENGLCCAPAPQVAAPAGAPMGKRAPCQTDQSCNEDESISALWGKCTPLGVCECKAGFELNPKGRCQKSAK